MFFKKIVSLIVISSFFLTGCVANTAQKNTTKVGPRDSSSFFETEVIVPVLAKPKLDVIIPAFNPNLPDDPKDYEDEGIWPELRRAEALRFAYKLKEALDKTEAFGAVRVTPDQTATGDLYILGTIEESNGAEVEIDVKVLDISGDVWFDKSFDHEIHSTFHEDYRNKGKDSYDPLFEEASIRIVKELKSHSDEDLASLQYLTDLRFGASFSEGAFSEHMEQKGNKLRLVSKPSDDDPMLHRVKALRIRDQMFVDGFQRNYSTFTANMNDSYLMWQEQSLIEIEAEREATQEAVMKGVGGVLLIGLSVLSGVMGATSDDPGVKSSAQSGAVLGGMAGVALLKDSFKVSEEAEVHRDTLNELGESVDADLAPQVVEVEENTVKLTGDAQEQFMQWRTFLKKIYEQEATPDKQL